eukprot:TRINITY_DN13138_c0_g1_i1.p1 TRINITY_DN13138_c0_g1~~TRINITY_DN13138_c0_g1_i1.p1  ORF type:complete len:299 (+),score=54.42 TRINITY_DN13138_c0_g1_i1:54-899(+)
MGNTQPQTSAPFVLDKKQARSPTRPRAVSTGTSPGGATPPRNSVPMSVPVSTLQPPSPDDAQSIADSLANDSMLPSSPLPSPRPPTVTPTVFKWRGGAKEVYLMSDLDNWRTRIPLSRSGVEFHTILDVPQGTHYYRFVVDGVVRSAPEQPVGTADDGGLANIIDVSPTDETFRDTQMMQGSPPGAYTRDVPSLEDYRRARDPPILPPHLHRALLNSPPPTDDSNTLPVPAHVVLNHLYSAARTDGVMLLGVTHRYRTKFVTTVFYTPCNQTGPLPTAVKG